MLHRTQMLVIRWDIILHRVVDKKSSVRFGSKDSPKKKVREVRGWCHFARQRATSCLRCSIGNFVKVLMANATPPAVQS